MHFQILCDKILGNFRFQLNQLIGNQIIASQTGQLKNELIMFKASCSGQFYALYRTPSTERKSFGNAN